MKEVEVVVEQSLMRDKVAKALLTTVATLFVTAIIETAYDAYMTHRRTQTAEDQQ